MSIKHRRLFYLDSANRASGVDSGDVKLEVKIPPHETFTHVCVLDMNIAKSYYMIQANYNTFAISESGVPRIITLTPANYGATCFRVCLTDALNLGAPLGWVYTVTYPTPTQPQTGKWTITVTGNAGVQPSIVTTTHVYEQLGFASNSTNAFVGDSITSTNVIKLQSEDALYLHSDIVTEVGDDILQEIYTVGVPDFGIINYKCSDWQSMAKPMSSMSSNVYRFTLTDENNRPMNLNGQNWVMTLMVCTLERPLQLSI